MKEYGDSIAELKVEEQHLEELENEKIEIKQKYFSSTIKTPQTLKKQIYDKNTHKKIVKTGIDETFFIKGKGKTSQPFLECLIEIENKDIDNQIEESKNKIEKLHSKIESMRAPLNEVKGYEKRLYLYILEGFNITQAVKRVAEDTDRSERTIWRYAKRLRNILSKYNIDDKIEFFI